MIPSETTRQLLLRNFDYLIERETFNIPKSSEYQLSPWKIPLL